MRRHEQPEPINLPCAGGAFSFEVTVHERWARPGDPYELEIAFRNHADTLRAQTDRRLRGISRRYRPEDAEEFERTANAEVSKSWGFSDDPALACILPIHAAPDADLRKELRAVEIERLQADAARQRAVRGACDTASRAYQDKGLYEFAISMDSPLSRLVSYVNGEHEPRGEETSATS